MSQDFKRGQNPIRSMGLGMANVVAERTTDAYSYNIHYHPKDYFRFCPQGLEALFTDMKTKTIDIIRDQVPDEDLPRQRIVAIFQKKRGA